MNGPSGGVGEGDGASQHGRAGWLRERRPAPPQELVRRLAGESFPIPDGAGADGKVDTDLATAAMKVLGRAVEKGRRDRTAALDLLVADGLMTYACEAAAASPDPEARVAAILERFMDFESS